MPGASHGNSQRGSRPPGPARPLHRPHAERISGHKERRFWTPSPESRYLDGSGLMCLKAEPWAKREGSSVEKAPCSAVSCVAKNYQVILSV